MLDVRLFKQSTFAVPAFVLTLGTFVTWGLLFLLPQFLQLVDGRSALWVGMVVSVISITWCVSATTISIVIRRVGERAVLGAGILLTAVGTACFLQLDRTASTVWVVVGLCIIGLGMGTATTPATSMLVSDLPPEKAGVGSAMNDVTREFGTAFGVAALGTIVAFRYSARLLDVTAALPAGDADSARNNLSDALDVGRRVGGARGEQLADAARSAFTSGLTVAVGVSVVLLVALALIVFTCLPHSRRVRFRHPWGSPIARPAVTVEGQTAEP